MGTGYTIAEIVVYPVKGCRGVSVPSAAISFTGFLFDREWMVVKAENGRAITMSRAPKLALVQPSLPTIAMRGESVPASATLEINAPGMKALNVPLRKCPSTGKARQGERGHIVDVGMPTLKGVYEGQGVDEGPEAAAWFTQYLDIPARLVRFDPTATKENRQAEDAPEGYVTGFVNTGQFLFASEASLDKVNSYFTTAPFPMNRFRPNIVVRGPPSFEEDKWRQFTIEHMGTHLNFSYVMNRGMCKVPTINQDKPDLENVEPNKTMFTFRSGPHVGLEFEKVKKVYFGSYFVCDSTISTASNSKPHVIDVGDNLNVITTKHDDVSVNHASPKSGSLESNMDLCGPRPVELMY
ncbi:uncharacterized protein [Physcomitrium patens]|uniref:MOSC domain-containing protein n=2 Tax=Physcomitrium patens TaxID=3218 RepID=A0A7I4AEV3_PHYPA|nr:mitochondrial amidoxime reducing component 2-like isoform X1 [Physcomitrium patens]|eukprot:XP_024391319.1 mitochondrial amidoxime reducing component 2-like isoform X1 [Physcomitrella patens]